jgi:hypothetical protein
MKRVSLLMSFLLGFIFSYSQQRIVVMGSSTTAKTGLTSADTSWPEKLSMSAQPSFFINISSASTIISQALPTSSDTAINVVKAMSYNPTDVWYSYPNNAYDWMPISQIVSEHLAVANYILAHGAIPHNVGTQPRNTFSLTERQKLKTVDDTLAIALGKYYVSVFDTLVGSNYMWNPLYVQADGIHPNPLGHSVIFDKVWKQYTGYLSPSIFAGNDTTTTNSNLSLTYNVTNLNVGKYKAVLLLYDSLGNLVSKDSVDITKKDTAVIIPPPPPPNTNGKSIKVNLFSGTNPYTVGNWNNWNTVSNATSNNLIYDDGSQSTVNSTISQNSVLDNGAGYGGTMCPPQVLRYTSVSTSTRTLLIKGLNNSLTYNIEFYSSRPSSGNSTIFTINGVSKTVVTDNNLSNKIIYTSISPTNGQITVTLARVGTYNYLNGFIITEVSQSLQGHQSNIWETIPLSEGLIKMKPNSIVIPNLIHGQIDKLIIYDRLLRTMKVVSHPSGELDISYLIPGVYLITTYSKGRKETYKFLKL